MARNHFSLWIFNGSIFALGTYLLHHYLPSYDISLWAIILVFAAVVFLFRWMKTGLSRGESISFEFVVIMTFVLNHGFSGTWVVALGMLGFVLKTRQTLLESMFIIGSTVLSVWGASVVYLATGGKFGHLNIAHDYIPILGFMVSFLLFDLGLKAVNKSMYTDKSSELLTMVKDESLNLLLVMLVGVIATIVYQFTGLSGLFLVLLLMFGIWKLLKTYLYSEQKYIKTVETFLNVTENKIPHYRGHSERVTKFCQILMNKLRVTREERNTIEYAALLHDIGKLGMPENLLRIRSYLTNDEVRQLQSHSEVGKNLIKQIGGLDQVSELIYTHHEKFDGSGYPRGISGKDIPFGARVIAIANKFDNLVFRDGLRFEQACTEMKKLAGTYFDPDLVEIFVKALLNYNKVIPITEQDQITDRLEDSAKDIVEQLRYYLDKSWVLGALQMSYIVLYENNDLKNLGKYDIPHSVQKYLMEYIENVGIGESPCHKEFIVDTTTAKIYDAYFISISQGSFLITVFDMTEILKTERDREQRELKIYRDVILAVTQGKLLLTTGNEIKDYIDDEIIYSEMLLQDAQDVAKARELVREVLEKLPISKQRKSKMVLCVSEAATNVIKHVGEGQILIGLLDDSIRVIIKDNGPGIDISQLPQVTLRKGYSTKLSLGYGFTIMLDCLDRLIMGTKNGTTLVLEMDFTDKNGKPVGDYTKRKKVAQQNVN